MRWPHRLPAIPMRELAHRPASVLARIERGERLIVCRYGRPVATLQPLDGFVAAPFDGPDRDIYGSPLGDPSREVDKLSAVQCVLLRDCLQRHRLFPFLRTNDFPDAEVVAGLNDLLLRGLVRKSHRGYVLTGRGMILHETLTARSGAGPEGPAP